MTAEQLIVLLESAKNGLEEISLIHEYARLQIEKDRAQIIEKCALTLSSEYIIKELPIALD